MTLRPTLRPYLVAGLVGIWLVLAAIGSAFFEKLSEEQTQDPGDYLPRNAESTISADERSLFVPQSTVSAVLIFDGAPTAEQYAQFDDLAHSLPRLELGGDDGLTIGDITKSPVVVFPSADGEAIAAVLQVPFDAALAPREGTYTASFMGEAIRGAVVEAGIDGDIYLTGAIGLFADQAEAFSGIDGILLLVALVVVLAILLVVYRSPVLPFVVLATAGFALTSASLLVYVLAKNDLIVINGQSQAIMYILVVGATTDYSLLLVARYREELRRHASPYQALAKAWRRSLAPIVASGITVILCLLTLLFSDLASNQSLGPVASCGIAFAMLGSLTLLPAILLIGGERARWVFWPKKPTFHPEEVDVVDTLEAVEAHAGVWGKVSRLVARHPRRVWVGAVIGLSALAMFLPTFKAEGLGDDEVFTNEVESIEGLAIFSEHFAAGQTDPIEIHASVDTYPEVIAAVLEVDGVESAYAITHAMLFGAQPGEVEEDPLVKNDRVAINAVSSISSSTQEAKAVVAELRQAVHAVDPTAIVGGSAAISLDINHTTERDLRVIIPTILAVILLVLILLLRAIVAPLIIVAANVLSFAATMGLAALVFNHVWDHPGSDAFIPLFGFVFLVALGVDYSIFLMSRGREETLLRGTREGIRRALAVTGGVITSAGVVLAATFGAMAVMPILFMIQMAFVVAAGILLDTLVVRTLLLPGLIYDIDRASWWPWHKKIAA